MTIRACSATIAPPTSWPRMPVTWSPLGQLLDLKKLAKLCSGHHGRLDQERACCVRLQGSEPTRVKVGSRAASSSHRSDHNDRRVVSLAAPALQNCIGELLRICLHRGW